MKCGQFYGSYSLQFVRHQPKSRFDSGWWTRLVRLITGGVGNPALEKFIPDKDEPFGYLTAAGQYITLDKEFLTDRATTPRRLWGIRNFSPADWTPAALVHDWLYETHHRGADVLGFAEANALLVEMVQVMGVRRRQARLIGWACQTFSKKLWSYHYDPVTGEPDYSQPVAPPAGGLMFYPAAAGREDGGAKGTHKART